MEKEARTRADLGLLARSAGGHCLYWPHELPATAEEYMQALNANQPFIPQPEQFGSQEEYLAAMDRCYETTLMFVEMGVCPYEHHYYAAVRDNLFKEWAIDSREEKAEAWKNEQERLHRAPHTRGWGKQFGPLERQNYFESQPPFFITRPIYHHPDGPPVRYPTHVESTGVEPITGTRVVVVRVSSTPIKLLMGLPISGNPASVRMGKNAKKRLIRRGILNTTEKIDTHEYIAGKVEEFWDAHQR